MLTAALVAGVGVAGASATDATPSQAHSAAQTGLAPSPSAVAPSAPSTPAPALSTPAPALSTRALPSSGPTDASVAGSPGDADSVVITPPATGTGLSWIAPKRKAKPAPVTAPWVNPLPEAAVTSCFGQRWGRLHAGVDLAAADGTRIRAAGAGVVVAAGEAEGYGNAVLIDHGNGFLTHYGHMSAITVKVGQHVKAGEQIGNEGSTGHSTGPHLHFEVHQGHYKNPIEPTQWMHEHGVDIPGCVTFTN